MWRAFRWRNWGSWGNLLLVIFIIIFISPIVKFFISPTNTEFDYDKLNNIFDFRSGAAFYRKAQLYDAILNTYHSATTSKIEHILGLKQFVRSCLALDILLVIYFGLIAREYVVALICFALGLIGSVIILPVINYYYCLYMLFSAYIRSPEAVKAQNPYP